MSRLLVISTLSIAVLAAAAVAGERNDSVTMVALAAPQQEMSAIPTEPEPVEAMFADAPDGVDPMVTGPVSVAFKQRQQRLGCDGAAWPHIPSGCYPD